MDRQVMINARQWGKHSHSYLYSGHLEILEGIEFARLMRKFYSSPVGELFK